ncbi:alpha/beta fold hydrolase [Kineococcus indalonis]|uniref:alpha/beta fold hydrolase n=1 Tax=Kineococcus indalonis TaxID=2696566 RepID=UPI00196AF32E|nr:alpha/beta fold hydrolase [Kineococcus indalonis]
MTSRATSPGPTTARHRSSSCTGSPSSAARGARWWVPWTAAGRWRWTCPGTADPRDAYDVEEVAGVLHEALAAAGLREPVLVGHSLGGVPATVYAAEHPARAVLNIDQPLLPGPFGEVLRSLEPVLRGPDHLQVWQRLLAGTGTEQLSPPLRGLLRSTPRLTRRCGTPARGGCRAPRW